MITIENKFGDNGEENTDYEKGFLPPDKVQEFLGASVGDYWRLYRHYMEKRYCPCEDILLENGRCQKMVTMAEPLKKGINDFPKRIYRVENSRFNTGEIWTDDKLGIAYLYLGKLEDEKDVVYVLGGATSEWATVQTGYVNGVKRKQFFFERKVFPTNPRRG